MNEAELLHDLEAANLGLDLIFQVTYQVSNDDASLVVVLNRPQPEPLDYGYLKPKILAIIEKSELSEPTTIYFYSRIAGEEEPDWQDQVLISLPSIPTIPKSDPESEPLLDSAIAQEIKKDNSPKNTSKGIVPKDITEYRFGLSDYLIETISEPPESDVAEIVIAFDQLPQTDKHIFLNALEQFFVNQDRHTFEGLSPELEDLAQKIEKLNKRKQRSVSIWVARYCVKGEEILAIMNRGHIQATDSSSQPKSSEISKTSEASAVQTSRLQSSNSSTTNSATNLTKKELKSSSISSRSASNQSSVPKTNTSKNSNSNIVPLAIALVVVGIISGWVFNGAYQAAGWIAIVGFIHGFIWVVGVSYGNKLFLGSTVFNLVVIFFFRGYLFSQVIGIITGFFFAFAFNLSVKTLNHNGRDLFRKRGAIALGAILIGMIMGITLLGGGKSPSIASSNISSVGNNSIRITDDGEISMPETISKSTTLLRIENKSASDCLLTIQSMNVEKTAAIGGEVTRSTSIGAATIFTQTLANQSSDLPFILSTGNYRLACQENITSGANFEVVP